MNLRPKVELNRGSDLAFPVFWPQAPDSTIGMDLTGYAVDAFEPHPALVGHLTLAIVNPTGATFAMPASWQIRCQIDWQDDMPSGLLMGFAIRLTIGDSTLTTPKITVFVK